MLEAHDHILAHYYDLEYRGYTLDLDFYREYALAMDPERRLPVLELGCGTGRVAMKLAEAGFRVVGVDSSAGMLRVMKQKAEGAGLGERVDTVEADMRDLSSLREKGFNLAYCALNTFAYLPATDDQLAMLGAVRARLVEHGILIVDLTPPVPGLLPPGDSEVIHQGSYMDSDGSMMHKLVTGIARPATQTHDVTIFYDLENEDGALHRLSQRLTLRWTGRYEMEMLLRLAGYTVEQLYGSYELDEFGDESERMIFVART